jgi:hypothetical protein
MCAVYSVVMHVSAQRCVPPAPVYIACDQLSAGHVTLLMLRGFTTSFTHSNQCCVVCRMQVTSPIELNLLTEDEYYKHLKKVRAQQT